MLLYTYPENFRAYKALIAAQFSGAKVDVVPNFEFGVTNKTEEFLKKFPLGKVPALETDDGKYLAESNAIAYYVSNAQLRGNSDFEKAEVLQWLSFADGEIGPVAAAWVFPAIGIMQFNKNTNERAKQDFSRALETLQARLVNNTFLVGERITLADIVVFASLIQVFQHVADPSFRKPFFAVNRWFNTILNQPQTKAVVKNFTFCEKEATFDPKKYAEFQAKFGGGQQQVKKEKEKKENSHSPRRKRKRRRLLLRNRPKRWMLQNWLWLPSPSRRIRSIHSRREHSISMISRESTATKTRQNQFRISLKSSTQKTTRSGMANTNIPMN